MSGASRAICFGGTRAADPVAERAARDRVQRAKVGLGERGKPWWEQSASARRMRWQTAMAEIDALDAGGSA
jgi:hypothetical protein